MGSTELTVPSILYGNICLSPPSPHTPNALLENGNLMPWIYVNWSQLALTGPSHLSHLLSDYPTLSMEMLHPAVSLGELTAFCLEGWCGRGKQWITLKLQSIPCIVSWYTLWGDSSSSNSPLSDAPSPQNEKNFDPLILGYNHLEIARLKHYFKGRPSHSWYAHICCLFIMILVVYLCYLIID